MILDSGLLFWATLYSYALHISVGELSKLAGFSSRRAGTALANGLVTSFIPGGPKSTPRPNKQFKNLKDADARLNVKKHYSE